MERNFPVVIAGVLVTVTFTPPKVTVCVVTVASLG